MSLSIENLEIIKGGKKLICNFNARMDRGTITGLLGPNGVGKSSLLRVIAGLDKPYSGSIKITGKISFLPQDYNLNTDLNVLETILLGRARYLKWYEHPSLKDLEKAENIIDKMKLSNLKSERFMKLSGGQKQLVLIAQSLVSDCEILLLDEPSSALDLLNQERLYSTLKSLKYENKICIIFSTHEPNQVVQVSDSVILMSHDHHIYGNTEKIMSVKNLNEVYNVNFEKINSIKRSEHVFFNHLPS